MPTDRELEEELNDLAQRIERLRIHYQQYFLGLEKVPPLVMREQLERRIRESPLNDVRKAAFKFRFNSLLQRLRTYEVYWDRLERDIEEGRFERGMVQDGLRRPPPEPPLREHPLFKDPVETLYREFIEARKKLGLPVDGITLDAFRVSIERQRRIQAEKLGVEDVEFSVVVKDGKVILQARPKKA